MSDDEYIKLLRANDDPTYSEAPPGFDRAAAESRLVKFANHLNSALGVECAFESGLMIQDASHHGDIRLPKSLLKESLPLGVRVSNFGRFCTVYNDDSLVKPDVLATIKRVASEHGYVYVPSPVLEMPYDGENTGVSGFRDWGERFFDWI
jgi:hypothetical protein